MVDGRAEPKSLLPTVLPLQERPEGTCRFHDPVAEGPFGTFSAAGRMRRDRLVSNPHDVHGCLLNRNRARFIAQWAG